MSKHITRGRWPLYLAIVALTAAFSWVFLISVERAKTQRSTELTLEMSDARPGTQNLQITPKLGTLPPESRTTRSLPQPAPWWPAMLFGLAFLCGWLYRHGIWVPRGEYSRANEHAISQPENIPAQPVDGGSSVSVDEQPVTHTAFRTASGPDLGTDFPWDESVLDDTEGLTSEEHIARLKKQNASKAEIIKALELLVTENREKWLHQDETEYRLNSHIQTLSDDLRVAIQQLQRLQTDTTGAHKTAIESQP